MGGNDEKRPRLSKVQTQLVAGEVYAPTHADGAIGGIDDKICVNGQFPGEEDNGDKRKRERRNSQRRDTAECASRVKRAHVTDGEHFASVATKSDTQCHDPMAMEAVKDAQATV